MTRRLILHLGHPKTGSSAIQSFLARNADQLRSIGIYYPQSRREREAGKGAISSGNPRDVRQIGKIARSSIHHTVFSSENIFVANIPEIYNDTLAKQLIGTDIKPLFVIYTRNLFPFIFSGWGQYIKRHGGTLGLRDFIVSSQEEDDAYRVFGPGNFQRLAEWIVSIEYAGFDWAVYNYDKIDCGISTHFARKALGIATDAPLDWTFDTRRVNRSLTMSEYEVQIQFNRIMGKSSSRIISDRLVNDLPDLNGHRPYISYDEYIIISEIFRSSVDSVNKLIRDDQRIHIEEYKNLKLSKEPCDITLTRDQLRVITESLCREILILKNRSIWSAFNKYIYRIIQKITKII